MLELDPKKRISAAEAKQHPYFVQAPIKASPEEMPKIVGDSHEFLLRVQQVNRSLLGSSAMSEQQAGAKKRRMEAAVLGATNGKLLKKKKEELLEPSTKESATVSFSSRLV